MHYSSVAASVLLFIGFSAAIPQINPATSGKPKFGRPNEAMNPKSGIASGTGFKKGDGRFEYEKDEGHFAAGNNYGPSHEWSRIAGRPGSGSWKTADGAGHPNGGPWKAAGGDGQPQGASWKTAGGFPRGRDGN